MMLAARTEISAVLVVTLMICPFGSPMAAPVSGAMHVCAQSPISIKASEPVNLHDICESAENALAFFGRLDLGLTHPLVIEVVPNLPDWMRETAVGCYQEDEQTVFVLTFQEFKKRKDWFGLPINRSMYRSVVTHEVAHAIARCNFTIPEPTVHAEEYAAYVAMFVMMDPAFRARALMEYPGARFDGELEINEITYFFDPMRFGIAAYRHYLEKDHGNVFLREILSGKELTNSVGDFP